MEFAKNRKEPLYLIFDDPHAKDIRVNAAMSRKHHAFWVAKWKLCGDPDLSFQKYIGGILEKLAESTPKF